MAMNIKEAAKQFDAQRRRCRAFYFIYGLGMIAGLAMMFLQQMKAALLFFSLLLIVYFVVVRSNLKQYTADWREFCVRLFTEKYFAPVSYTYAAKADRLPLYTKHTLMPKSEKGKLLARNLASGSREGIEAMFLDSTVPTGDGSSTRFYSGCWMGFAFDSFVRENIRIVKGELLVPGAYKNWLIRSEGFKPCAAPEGMPKDCAVFSASGALDLPLDVIVPLKKLLKIMSVDGVIEISPEGLFVFLPHRLINKLPPSLKYPITENMIDRLTFPEIDAAHALAQHIHGFTSDKKGERV